MKLLQQSDEDKSSAQLLSHHHLYRPPTDDSKTFIDIAPIQGRPFGLVEKRLVATAMQPLVAQEDDSGAPPKFAQHKRDMGSEEAF